MFVLKRHKGETIVWCAIQEWTRLSKAPATAMPLDGLVVNADGDIELNREL